MAEVPTRQEVKWKKATVQSKMYRALSASMSPVVSRATTGLLPI